MLNLENWRCVLVHLDEILMSVKQIFKNLLVL